MSAGTYETGGLEPTEHATPERHYCRSKAPQVLINAMPHVHYSTTGNGEAVLLIHGLGSSGADWAFQVAALESRFRVITPDLPGSGRSKALAGAPGIAELAQSLWSLMDELHIVSVNIAGFSLGGAVALEMALQRPAHVPKLMLINSLATYRVDHWTKWFEARVARAMVRVLGMRAMARMFTGRSFPEPWQKPMRDRAVAVVGAVPATSYLAMAAALERWSATERLHSLRSTVLVLAAERDITPLAEKQALASRLGAVIVIARGSRHATPFDSIELTNASMLALFDGQPLPASERRTRDGCANQPLWAQALRHAAEHSAHV